MAESVSEQIEVAAAALLDGMAVDGGVTCHYKPHAVLRPPAFTSECLNASLGDGSYEPTIYCLVSDDQEEAGPGAYARVRIGFLPLDLVVAQRFTPASEDPFSPPATLRRTIQRRLVRDATIRLFSDRTLAGLAINLEIPLVDMSPENTFVESWALAFMHLRYQYQATEALP